MNPVESSKSKLKFRLTSASTTTPVTTTTSFVAKEFVNNSDGSYTGHYAAGGLGSYGICVLFEDKQLPPCPFEVTVHAGNFSVSTEKGSAHRRKGNGHTR
jgi:hypothetical protein